MSKKEIALWILVPWAGVVLVAMFFWFQQFESPPSGIGTKWRSRDEGAKESCMVKSPDDLTKEDCKTLFHSCMKYLPK